MKELTLYKPDYYHRNYKADLPKATPNWEVASRVGLAALPVIALYGPLGSAVTASLGLCRSVTNLQKLTSAKNFQEGFYFMAQVAIALSSVALTILAHPCGMLINTGNDLLHNVVEIKQALDKGDFGLAFNKSFQLLHNGLYLSIFLNGSVPIQLAAISLQILLGLYEASKKLNLAWKATDHTDRLCALFELFCQLVVTGVQSNRALDLYELYSVQEALKKPEITLDLDAVSQSTWQRLDLPLVLIACNHHKTLPPLQMAIKINRYDAFNSFLTEANIGLPSSIGTPLELSLKLHRLQMSEDLLNIQAPITERCIPICCEEFNAEGLSLLFKEGAALPNNSGKLLFSVLQNHPKHSPISPSILAKILIKNGADCRYLAKRVIKEDKVEIRFGLLPLASKMHDEELSQLLIEGGAPLVLDDTSFLNILKVKDSDTREKLYLLDPTCSALSGSNFIMAKQIRNCAPEHNLRAFESYLDSLMQFFNRKMLSNLQKLSVKDLSEIGSFSNWIENLYEHSYLSHKQWINWKKTERNLKEQIDLNEKKAN